ncbi:22048_t:CDS:2, partial [Rhizophagus irregularis]
MNDQQGQSQGIRAEEEGIHPLDMNIISSGPNAPFVTTSQVQDQNDVNLDFSDFDLYSLLTSLNTDLVTTSQVQDQNDVNLDFTDFDFSSLPDPNVPIVTTPQVQDQNNVNLDFGSLLDLDAKSLLNFDLDSLLTSLNTAVVTTSQVQDQNNVNLGGVEEHSVNVSFPPDPTKTHPQNQPSSAEGRRRNITLYSNVQLEATDGTHGS